MSEKKIIVSNNTEDETSKSYDNFSILNYFVGHPGVFTACISGLIATIGFVWNVVIQKINIEYFKYWGLNTDLALKNSGKSIHVFVFALVLTAIWCLTSISMQGFFVKQYKRLIPCYADGQMLKIARASLRRTAKITKAVKKKLNKAKKRESTNPQSRIVIQELECDIRELSEQSENIKRELLELKESASKERKKLLTKILGSLLLCTVLFCLVSWIQYSFVLSDSIDVMIYSGVVTVLQILCSHRRAYVSEFKPIKKLTVSLSQLETLNQLSKVIREAADNSEKKATRSILDNHSIILTIASLVSVLVVLLVSATMSSWSAISRKSEFMITKIEEQDYAIMHIDNDFFYLEEVEVTGNTIHIDVSKQRIVKDDDISYEVISFDEVIKLNDRSDGIYYTLFENIKKIRDIE